MDPGCALVMATGLLNLLYVRPMLSYELQDAVETLHKIVGHASRAQRERWSTYLPVLFSIRNEKLAGDCVYSTFHIRSFECDIMMTEMYLCWDWCRRECTRLVQRTTGAIKAK